MLKCKNCGLEIENGKFCPSCGCELLDEEVIEKSSVKDLDNSVIDAEIKKILIIKRMIWK
ncbi:zinc ribbon domain-containing protein [Methanobrevibacter oralis]|uniref:zinc ribbon domain-containing protein n=1 Tax=Methanobrevibacter oralis TaxID=66851 RepID=UPI0005B28CB8|nr:zinc ribbon domain-containing protein [Methanobrevibacter oralis]